MIERWIRFWDQREAPHSLALVRLLVGVALFGDLVQAAIFDVVPLVMAPPPFGGGYGQTLETAPLVVRFFGASPATGFAVWALALAACALFTAGIAYRLTSFVLVFALVELDGCQPVGDSIDSLLRIVLPVLAVSGAGKVWSFDAWWRRRRGKPAPGHVPAWPRYLIVIQLLWIYVSAGHQRDVRMWGPPAFSALANVLGDPHFARFEPGTFEVFYPLLRVATAVTMLFELTSPLYPLWLWLEVHPGRGGRFGAAARRFRLRWLWLALGVSLHAGIAVGMKIGLFPFGMLALYPAFVRPPELLAALAWLKAAAERRRLRPA